MVHGIPIKVNQENQDQENPLVIAMEICKMVGVQAEVSDFDMAHRLPKGKNAKVETPPPFIMRLVSRFKKEEIMNKAKEIKPNAAASGGREEDRVFFNEHLTKRNQIIQKEAKRL